MSKHPATSIQLGLGLLAVLAAGALLAVVASAQGGGSAGQRGLAQARHETAFHVHREERLRRLERDLGAIKSQRPDVHVEVSPPAPSQGTEAPGYDTVPDYDYGSGGYCGEEVSVDSQTTTCPFARNVKRAYYEEVGSGSGIVEAHSPKTHHSYTMYCTPSPHECTGGREAAVYFP